MKIIGIRSVIIRYFRQKCVIWIQFRLIDFFCIFGKNGHFNQNVLISPKLGLPMNRMFFGKKCNFVKITQRGSYSISVSGFGSF